MKERNYTCSFCHHQFVFEERFIAHRCKSMIRDEEFRSPTGQAAWSYYQKWMKAYQRIVPKSQAFIKSKFYVSFIKFTKFVKKTNMPDTDTFIWLMKEKDISPTIWCNDQVYSLYLEFIDRRAVPEKQAQITIDTLFKLADAGEIEVSEVFDLIEPNELIQLLRQRRISPWILLNSAKFREFFINKTTPEQKIILESIIRPDYWKEKFTSNPKIVKKMKLYIDELQL